MVKGFMKCVIFLTNILYQLVLCNTNYKLLYVRSESLNTTSRTRLNNNNNNITIFFLL